MVDNLINHKSVATWIHLRDYEVLKQLAERSQVTLATYMRAIIVDAVQEELELINARTNSKTTNTKSSSPIV